MSEKVSNRQPVVRFLGGSHMRNLNHSDSDIDYKYFVLPTKEDLFTTKVFTDFKASPTLDIDTQDVRRLDNLFYKSNPAYLDLLFSPEIIRYGFKQIDEIIEMRDDIARMNLSYLYSASMGMFNQNTKDLTNPTSEKVKALIAQHGYNTKKFSMAVHFSRFIQRFHSNDYSDYKSSIWYEGERRQWMLSLKNGLLPLDAAKAFLEREEDEMKMLRADYSAQPVNDETHVKLKQLLRDLVFDSLKEGIIE